MEIVGSCPADTPLHAVPDLARRAERLGFDVLHVSETVHDPFVTAALALTSTDRLTVRTSMVVAFPRSPMVVALAAWDLAGLSGGRFQLGLASQVRGNVVDRFSSAWSEPVARLEDYVRAVRAIFTSFQTGAPLSYEGTQYRFTRLQPYFNPGPLEGPQPEVWTGGVNEGMCALAGRVSDGFVSHPTSSHPRVLEERTLPALDRGRGDVGRDQLPRVVVGPQPLLAETADGLPAAREARRAELGFLYSTPAYRMQLDVFGLGHLGEALTGMPKSGDWSELGRHITDEVLDLLVPQATYADLAEVLGRWYAGRCDGLVLQLPAEDRLDPVMAEVVEECRKIPTLRRAA